MNKETWLQYCTWREHIKGLTGYCFRYLDRPFCLWSDDTDYLDQALVNSHSSNNITGICSHVCANPSQCTNTTAMFALHTFAVTQNQFNQAPENYKSYEDVPGICSYNSDLELLFAHTPASLHSNACVAVPYLLCMHCLWPWSRHPYLFVWSCYTDGHPCLPHVNPGHTHAYWSGSFSHSGGGAGGGGGGLPRRHIRVYIVAHAEVAVFFFVNNSVIFRIQFTRT